MSKSKIRKRICHLIYNITFKSMLNYLSTVSKAKQLIIVPSGIIVGLVLNKINPMEMFIVKLLIGVLIFEILLRALNYLWKNIVVLNNELAGDPALSVCKKIYYKRINSNINYLLPIFSGLYFVVIAYELNFIKENLLGLYSLFALFIVVFIAFVAYQQYIYILILLYDFSGIEIKNYNNYIPEATRWFKRIILVSTKLKDSFFILATLFLMLYIIFSPNNTIDIIFNYGMESEMYIPLLITWIIIIITVIISFPILNHTRNLLINRIVLNMKEQSIEKYSELIKKSDNDCKVFYMNIILRMYERKKNIQDKNTWSIPVITTTLNLATIVLSIILDLKELNISFRNPF